jgi:hypothetical protein
VIVGRLIPAGTGLAYHKLRKQNLTADLIDTSTLSTAEEEEVAAQVDAA